VSTRSFFVNCYGDHRDLHSFPTRRSSDLSWSAGMTIGSPRPGPPEANGIDCQTPSSARPKAVGPIEIRPGAHRRRAVRSLRKRRSEEHTSELQSPCNLVCRLLLEKKKKQH